MPADFDLPDIFREHGDPAYTAEQLQPTLDRLRAAVRDLDDSPTSPQTLIAAWTRIAELRLPRKAVPAPVLRELEALVVDWGTRGIGGIAAHAYSLTDEQRSIEAQRIHAMLAATETAAANAPTIPLYQTE